MPADENETLICYENVVKVSDSLVDELSGVDLAGSKGIVRSIYDPEEEGDDPLALIEFLPETLSTLPQDFLIKQFDAEQSWNSYLIPLNKLTRLEEKADQRALGWEKQAIFTKLFLPNLDREGRMIAKVFAELVDPTKISPMECWLQYLEKNLRFPFKGILCYPYEEDDGPLTENEVVLITGLAGIDKALGIWADVEVDERPYSIPLQDILSKEPLSKNGRYIDAYGLWIACSA